MIVTLAIFWALTLHAGTMAATRDDSAFIDSLFPSHIDIATDVLGAHSVESADLDNDGDLDLISASREDGRLRWYRHEGGGSAFTSIEIDTINGAYIAVPGDIDGDGDVDIAVAAVSEVRPSSLPNGPDATSSTGAILWYENDGLAQFQRHIIFSEVDYPVSIHLADLNRDGDLDLLSASRDDNHVRWYENDGDRQSPRFTPYTLTDSALGAVSVSTADFDGDGDLDVVSASEDDNQIAWYENIGPQPLQFVTHIIQQASEPVPSEFDYAKSVYGADVDGDGDMDIVYGSENDNLLGWYRNVGGQPLVFEQQIVATQSDHAKYVTAADVDLDGDTDLFVASTGDHTVAWYENDGAAVPAFVRHVVSTQSLGARYVHVADLDGDGDMDVLTASRDDNRVTWYQNRTIHRSAHFPARGVQSVATGENTPMDVAAGDLDNDGRSDIVILNDESLIWAKNVGSDRPEFMTRVIEPDLPGGRQIDVADLNQNGRNDLLFVAGDGTILGWYENVGGEPPSFRSQIINANAGELRAMQVGDIDSDGDLDVVSAGENGLHWYENRMGDASFVVHGINETAVTALTVTDLDRDGRPDLIAAHRADDALHWHRNRGTHPPTFADSVIVDTLSAVEELLSADLDGDGDIDLLSRSGESGVLTWHKNRGGQAPEFMPEQLDSGLTPGTSLEIADMDQDGDLDILAGGEDDTNGRWYENNGEANPSFSRRTLAEVAARPVTAADVDGDGDLDLLAIDSQNNTVHWVDNGGGQFGATAFASLPAWSSLTAPLEMASLNLTHRGRPVDNEMTLSELTVHFTDLDGRPLTAAQVQQRYSRFYLYRDRCCDGVYDPEGDLLAAQVNAAATASDGMVTFVLPTVDSSTQIAAEETGTFFFAATLRNLCNIGIHRHQIAFSIADETAVDALTGKTLHAESDATGIPSAPARRVDFQARPNNMSFEVLLPVIYGVPDCVR